jgi:predicted RNA-binding protein with PIN domain
MCSTALAVLTSLAAVAAGWPTLLVRTLPPVWARRCVGVRALAKGDGKRRRPKQTEKQAEASPPPPSPPPASRISRETGGQRGLSVRTQIRLVRRFRAQAAPSRAQRVRFRRDKANAERRGDEDEVDWEFGQSPPLLLVDGYNVIGFWARLKKRKLRGDLAGARDMLIEDLSECFADGRFEPCVVFDANGACNDGGKSRFGVRDRSDLVYGVEVVYAHDSADAFIERETRRLQGSGRTVVTATNDNAVRVAASAHGATALTTNWLVSELKASRAATPQLLDEFNQRQERLGGGRSAGVWDALDPALRSQLDDALKQDATNALSRKDREAAAAARALRSEGALALGDRARALRAAAARRKRPASSRKYEKASGSAEQTIRRESGRADRGGRASDSTERNT